MEANYLTASVSVTLRTAVARVADLAAESASLSSVGAAKRLDDAHHHRMCLSVHLLLARISWLLLCRLSRLQDLFLAAQLHRLDASTLTGGKYGLKFSDYQIKSAFEIADTDGDGLISYQEFVEVLNYFA